MNCESGIFQYRLVYNNSRKNRGNSHTPLPLRFELRNFFYCKTKTEHGWVKLVAGYPSVHFLWSILLWKFMRLLHMNDAKQCTDAKIHWKKPKWWKWWPTMQIKNDEKWWWTMMNNAKQHLTTHYAKPHKKDNKRRRRWTRMNNIERHRTMHEDNWGQDTNWCQTKTNNAYWCLTTTNNKEQWQTTWKRWRMRYQMITNNTKRRRTTTIVTQLSISDG